MERITQLECFLGRELKWIGGLDLRNFFCRSNGGWIRKLFSQRIVQGKQRFERIDQPIPGTRLFRSEEIRCFLRVPLMQNCIADLWIVGT